MKILLAEDNKLFSDALTLRLTKAIKAAGDIDAEIFVTGYLCEALAKSVEWQPDITLFDPTLGDSPNWVESLKAIKTGWRGQAPFYPPVFVVTGMEKTPELIKACIDAGAMDVYYKPWDMNAVEKIVSDMAGAILKRRREAKGAPEGTDGTG